MIPRSTSADPGFRPVPSSAVQRVLSDSAQLYLLQCDPLGLLVGWNEASARAFGLDAEEERLLDELVVDHARPIIQEMFDNPTPPPTLQVDFVGGGDNPFTLHCRLVKEGSVLHVIGERDVTSEAMLSQTLLEVNQELAVLSREAKRKSRELAASKEELERTLEELKTTHWHLEKVQEVISLCMRCGKIRADAANWETLQEYLVKNEIFTSHGFCPDCGAQWEDEIEKELNAG